MICFRFPKRKIDLSSHYYKYSEIFSVSNLILYLCTVFPSDSLFLFAQFLQ
jgi:hypothetical protein